MRRRQSPQVWRNSCGTGHSAAADREALRCRRIGIRDTRSRPLRRASASPLCKRVGPGSPLRCVRDDTGCVARLWQCRWSGFLGQPRHRALRTVTGTASPRPSAARTGAYSFAERGLFPQSCGRLPARASLCAPRQPHRSASGWVPDLRSAASGTTPGVWRGSGYPQPLLFRPAPPPGTAHGNRHCVTPAKRSASRGLLVCREMLVSTVLREAPAGASLCAARQSHRSASEWFPDLRSAASGTAPQVWRGTSCATIAPITGSDPS